MPRVVEPDARAIDEAVQLLKAGKPVAFPTETVYGLGADTFNPMALQFLYSLKGRPTDNPLIAHVAEPETARRITVGWSEHCERLVACFWPGPLTLILQKAGEVPELATAGRRTIAVRCPRHPVAQDLLRAFPGPISAPSANRSGHVSPTSARHVAEEFSDERDLMILDGGSCAVGIESTVLDLTGTVPRILRPGSVTGRELEEIVGPVDRSPVRRQADSPGTSPAHYAPSIPAAMVDLETLHVLLRDAEEPAFVLCFDSAVVPPPHRAVEMPQGAGDYARALYAALRQAEASGCRHILIEEPPRTHEMWQAVLDRLDRATRGAQAVNGVAD